MKNKKGKLNLAAKTINQWFKYQRYISRIPSLSYSVTHKGEELTSGAYGWADVKEEKKADTQTRYRAASITKMFTAVSILQLYEEGKLKLDDRLHEHIGWLNEEKGSLTIRQLLSHRSGIDRNPNERFWAKDEIPTLQGLKEKIKNDSAGLEPMERFKYSNLGFALLGLIVESVSGTSYKKYVKQNIIEPLNLKNTYIGLSEESKKKLAVGYGRDIKEGEPREAFSNKESGALTSAAGLITTASDLTKFLNALFLDDELLNKEALRLMKEKNVIEEEDSFYYGLGLVIWKEGGYEIMGHDGGHNGYISVCGINEKNKVSIAVLTNGLAAPASGLMKGAFSIISYFLSLTLKEEDQGFEKYEGIYSNRWGESGVIASKEKLFIYPISTFRPFEGVAVVKKEDDKLKVSPESKSSGAIGEEIKFQMKDGKVKKLIYANTPSEPFKVPDYKCGY